MSVQKKISDLMRDPAVSDWLKVAITATGRRDPIDTLDDVAMLGEICRDRLSEM